MATKFGQKNKIAQSSIPSKKSRNCKQVNTGLLNSNMLPEYSTEPRESPWQPKLCKNKPKFGRNQFSKSYGYNVCVCGTVFDVEEFKYANKNFRGAKGVAIATKFTQKGEKCTDFSSVRNIVPISTYMIGFRGCRIQICHLNFQGTKRITMVTK